MYPAHDPVRKGIAALVASFLLFSNVLTANLPGSSNSQAGPNNQVFQNQIYEAYVLSNISLWERTIRDMEAAYAANPGHALLYDILLAQYGLIGYYLGINQKVNGQRHLEKAERNAERLATVRSYNTSAMVFQAAFLAFRINLKPLRAVQLGPRSYRLIDLAMEADPTYARVWIEKANAAFYTPSIFGGDKPGAVDYYRKAISIFEQNMENNHRWLYLNTLAAMANAQKETGNVAGAIQTLEKTLRIEPRFKWVRDELLPAYRRD